ncbi:MAG TPA: hypothetical protein VJ812_04620 [Gemmatimonadaceae bacterium]|nr:hypothetical protein [Gemmatimonadaceae bacterium]
MNDTLLLRDQFSVDDRTFTVLAEPWYDADVKEWRARYLYLPLDRSLPEIVSSAPVKRARRRDELIVLLAKSTDRELTKALRTVLPAAPRRA